MIKEFKVQVAVETLIEKYTKEKPSCVFDEEHKTLMFEFDLGGRKVGFVYTPRVFLAGGLKGGYAHVTFKPNKHYKTIVKRVEKDIIQWRRDHRGLV